MIMAEKRYHRGNAIIVRISKRLADRAPSLEGRIGETEWFVVTSNGPTRGLMAFWELNPLIELKILESEIVQ